MKFLLALLLFPIQVTVSNAQTIDTVKVFFAMKVDATSFAEAFLKHDYLEYVRFTYPKIIDAAGSKENAISVLEKGSAKMKSDGLLIDSIFLGKPTSLFTVADELQSTIPQVLFLSKSGLKYRAMSTILSFSQDNGKTWKFVDTKDKEYFEMKKLIPNLSDKILIHPIKELQPLK